MARTKASLSIFLSHVDHLIAGDNAKLVAIAKLCEAAGADQVCLSEHVALSQRIEGQGEASKFPFQSDENYPEPLITLAAIAGATSRLRLATGILIAPLRPALVLAKMVATLDQVSQGRLDLGLGAGWHEPEFAGAGLDVARAMEMLENNLAACRSLWAGGPSSFSSSTVSFERLYCQPAPLRGRDLPVWLAGPPGRNAMRRVARLAQGWLPFSNLTVEEIGRGAVNLRTAEREQGLEEGVLGIRASLPTAAAGAIDTMLDQAFAQAPAYLDAGATQLQLPLWRYVKTIDEVSAFVTGARLRLDAL